MKKLKLSELPLKRIMAAVGLIMLPSILDKSIFTLAQKSHYKRNRDINWKSYLGDVNYTVYGTGSPVLLVHDTFKGGGLWEWDRNIMELGKYYRVYAFDLPGFGLSNKPWTVYTAYCYARLIKDFIKEVIGEKVYAVGSGHSAADIIQAASLEPELFSKIIAVCPTGLEKENHWSFSRLKRMIYSSSVVGTSLYTWAVSKRQIRKFLAEEVFYSKYYVNNTTVNTCWFYAHAVSERGKHPYAAFVADYLNTDIKKSITLLKVPLLTVWGEEAASNPVTNMKMMETLRPDMEYAVFEKTRMLPHFENSPEFNKLARDYFK